MSAPQRPLRAAVARGFTTLLTGRGVVLGLQLVTLGLLASHLGAAGLGVWTFGYAAATLFSLLPNFGLVPVLTREIAQKPASEPHLVPNVLYIRTLLGMAAYGLLAITMFALDFGSANTRAALIAGLILLVAFDVFRSSLEVRLKVGWIALADTVEAAATVLGTLALSRSGAGVESFLWMYVALKIVNHTIVGVVATRLVGFRWRVQTTAWRPVIAAAVPLGVAGVFMAIYYRIDVLILAWLKPAADVGQYGAAYRFLDAFSILPAITMTVLSPVFSRSVVEGGGRLARRFAESAHLVSIVAVFVSVVGAATAWRVLPELPGFEDFEGAGEALSILCPAAGLILVGTVVQGTLISAHLQGRLLRIAAIGLVANLALNAALIPPFSYIGASVATSVTELVLIALSVREARTRLALKWDRGRLVRLMLVGLLTGVALVPGFFINPFAQLAIASAVYLLLLRAFGVLPPDVLRLLRRGRLEAASGLGRPA